MGASFSMNRSTTSGVFHHVPDEFPNGTSNEVNFGLNFLNLSFGLP